MSSPPTPPRRPAPGSPPISDSNAPVHFAKDSVVDVNINLTAGGTPTADYTILLFWLSGEA
jgi:hypothetical protein